MTIARRRGVSLDPVAAPAAAPSVRPRAVPMGIRVARGDAPAPETVTPVGRLRRCTFRRLDTVSVLPGRSQSLAYEVMCLYGDRDEPVALGDVAEARPVCEACTATGIFRPDED